MTTVAPDLSAAVDLTIEPICSLDDCGRGARYVARSLCGATELWCRRCRRGVRADLRSLERAAGPRGIVELECDHGVHPIQCPHVYEQAYPTVDRL